MSEVQTIGILLSRCGVRLGEGPSDVLARLIKDHVALLAALESAPEPLVGKHCTDEDVIAWYDRQFVRWFHGPRAAAIAKVKP